MTQKNTAYTRQNGNRPVRVTRNGGGSRRSSRRRRRYRINWPRLIVFLLLVGLLVFGITQLVSCAHREPDPDYYQPTKITPAPEDPEDTGETGETDEGGEAYVPETEPEGTGEVETAPMDPMTNGEQGGQEEQQPEEDGGYFPEETAAQTPETVLSGSVGTVSQDGLRRATIRFAGDVVADTEILHTAITAEGKYDFSRYFSMITEQLSNADFTVMNVDGSMGGKEHYKYGYSGYPQFNTPETMLVALRKAGVDCLSLANNHCLDGWFDGLKDTIKNCDRAGMLHFGAYASQEAHDTPEIFEINGIKVGILNYTQSLNSMDKAGVDKNALIYGVRRMQDANYAADVKKMRAAGAEIVIANMHWGAEYLLEADDTQRSAAKALVKAGVDVIIGGHPHTPQPAGWVSAKDENGKQNRCLLVYSLGNFLSEHRNSAKAKTDSGYIFEFTLQENANGGIDVIAPKYIPIAVWRTGSEGNYDYRVVSVDDVLANRPAGMSDSAYTRMKEISREMSALIDSSKIERIAY